MRTAKCSWMLLGLVLLVATLCPTAWVSGWLSGACAPTTAKASVQPRISAPALARSFPSKLGCQTFTSAAFLIGLLLVRGKRNSISKQRLQESARVVALESGGISVRCLRTGAPVCFCSPSAQNRVLSLGKSTGESVQMRSLCFPGTDVPVDSEGVSFPIRATAEVGESGRSCTGEETAVGVKGRIAFTQMDAESCKIEYAVENLVPGDHGFHIHEKADFSNGCASAGPHYNPFGKWHAGPADLDRHVGDLGNITAGADGVAKGMMTDRHVKLFGEYSVVGRSIMIHQDPDDLGRGDPCGWPQTPAPPAPAQHTKTTGNAGARIGCGIINAIASGK